MLYFLRDHSRASQTSYVSSRLCSNFNDIVSMWIVSKLNYGCGIRLSRCLHYHATMEPSVPTMHVQTPTNAYETKCDLIKTSTVQMRIMLRGPSCIFVMSWLWIVWKNKSLISTSAHGCGHSCTIRPPTLSVKRVRNGNVSTPSNTSSSCRCIGEKMKNDKNLLNSLNGVVSVFFFFAILNVFVKTYISYCSVWHPKIYPYNVPFNWHDGDLWTVARP